LGVSQLDQLSLPLVGRRAFCNSPSTDCAPPCSHLAARCRHQLAIGGTWRKVDAAARSTLGSSMHGTMDGCDPWEFTGFILGSSGPVSYQPFTRAVSPMGSPSDMPPDRHGPLLPPDSAAIRSQSEPPPANDNYAPLRLSNRATTRPPPVPARQSPPLRDVARTAHFLSPTRPPRKRVGQHDLCAS